MVTCQLKVSALKRHLLITLWEAQMLGVHFLREEEDLFPLLYEPFPS